MNHRFLVTWVAVTLALLAVVAGFNAIVDPYGVLGMPRVVGFNAKKPASANRTAVVKPYEVARMDPSVLIVGNSRPEIGLDPKHRCLRSVGATFSLTIPGAGFYQQVRYLQNAFVPRHTKLILLAVDFLDFLNPKGTTGNPHRWPPGTYAFDNRLRVDARGAVNGGYRLAIVKDYRDSLLSLTALEDSIYTIASQAWPLAPNVTPDGFNPAHEYRTIIASEGQFVLFKQKNAEVRARLTRERLALYYLGSDWSPQLESLDRAIAEAKSVGAEVIVFINPYHQEYLEQIKEAGYWDVFLEWKSRVAETVVNKRGATFWDFANVNEFTSEEPPRPGDTKTVLRWFWEPAHYRKELGDLMLEQMLKSRGCSSAHDGAQVGVQVGGDIRAELRRWYRQAPY